MAALDASDCDLAAHAERCAAVVDARLLRLAEAPAAVRWAARRLDVQRLLLAGLALPALAAEATRLGAARLWGRCCWLLQALAPYSAYHAKWALNALRCAQRHELKGYAAYARHVLEKHCGPGALEVLLDAKGILEGLDPTASQAVPPEEIEVSWQLAEHLELSLRLPMAVATKDVELAANGFMLDLSLQGQRLLLPFPCDVVPEASVRLSKGTRLRATFRRL